MNIEQLAKNLVLGSYPANDEVAELIKWAYDRRHVEPNEANFHRLIKDGLSRKDQGFVMGAYRESFTMPARQHPAQWKEPTYSVWRGGQGGDYESLPMSELTDDERKQHKLPTDAEVAEKVIADDQARKRNLNEQFGKLGQPTSPIPGNFTTHRASWRKGLELAHNLAATTPDQQAYWAHEIAAYDRSFDRLLGTDSFIPPASLIAAVNVGIASSQAQWPAPGTNNTYAGYSDPLDIESKVQAQPRGPQPDHAHIKPEEIDPTDPRDTPPAAPPLSNDEQAGLKMPADLASVLATLVGHNGEMFDGTPANLDRLLPRLTVMNCQALKYDNGQFYSRDDVLRLFGNIV